MIVVGVDGSLPARAAVAWAANDAYRMHQPLRLVCAVDRQPYQIAKFPDPDRPDQLRRTAQKALNEAVALVHERQPSVEVTTRLEEGTPAVILREQGKAAVEVVVGSRGLGGITGPLLGSVSDQVAGHAEAPVVVVHGARRPTFGQVVVGVDGSPECRPALAYAFEQAALRGCGLRAVHAWRRPVPAFGAELPHEVEQDRAAREKQLRELVEPFTRLHPDVAVTEDVRYADAVEALSRASEEADLLVVGSHGRGAVSSALLGSVSRGVLHHARCTVAVVRAQ
ncbi:universal stress protein [Nonomuraea sp. FMUSA5-5]|uniref:Universal stress protein n=1 Tax=Nonomuraea composti TaxID=2720023 RepID=A0ABX1ASX6_9ACTN|nr:universal stress protein [Nonomuraea sp. FMUSA5-5]NJP88719.1 universal stress protein [Nonomuraea sp. FMUSA5-5]